MVAAGTRALLRKVAKLEERLGHRQRAEHPLLDQLRADLAGLMRHAGMAADAWQEQVLRSTASRTLMLASRQSGKSSVAAALALGTALLRPASPVLLLSPSLRQSGELFRKVVDLFGALGRPMAVSAESALRMEFANGSRVVSLPGDEKNVRCFSGVALLVLDEAARVPDALYYAVRPILAVSGGRLAALSTPFGKRGWFHDEWHGAGDWQRVRMTAEHCPRISAAFLAEEKRSLGQRWFEQEYMCNFAECIDAVFSYADILAAFADDVQPLFPV
jgi:hypothetical protein